MRIENLIIFWEKCVTSSKNPNSPKDNYRKCKKDSNKNMEIDTYPPSTISSTIDTTPSKLSISALFSTFFLSIWLIAS